MKCPKCGNFMKDGVCSYCGYKANSYMQNKLINNHKNNNNLLLILVFCCVISFFFIMGIGFRSLKDYEVKKYINIGNEKIPTVYNILGKKEIDNITKTKTTEKITYNLKNFSDDDLYNYVQKLYDLNCVDSKSKDGIRLVKEPSENGKIIVIDIKSSSSNIYFKYSYLTAKLSDFDVSGNITIGNNKYGYIDIPANFSKTINENNILQYQSDNEYVKLSIINQDTSIETYSNALLIEYKSRGLLCNISDNPVYGNNGYIIESIDKKNNSLIKTWIFKDKDNNFYTIEIKSNNPNSTIFNTFYTYRLEKN